MLLLRRLVLQLINHWGVLLFTHSSSASRLTVYKITVLWIYSMKIICNIHIYADGWAKWSKYEVLNQLRNWNCSKTDKRIIHWSFSWIKWILNVFKIKKSWFIPLKDCGLAVTETLMLRLQKKSKSSAYKCSFGPKCKHRHKLHQRLTGYEMVVLYCWITEGWRLESAHREAVWLKVIISKTK